METPFPAYRGDDRFVFVCYSHSDAGEVYPEIERLKTQGVNVWYDEGIRPGSEWTDELASAIGRCSKFLFFVTERSVQSRHCRDEVQYALKQGKSIVVVYLEEADLPPGLDLVLGSIQAVYRNSTDSARYLQRLLEAIWEDAATDEIAKSGIGHIPDPLPRAHRKARFPISPPWMIGALIALGIAALSIFYWRSGGDPEVEVAASAQATSIAVLPFEDRGGFAEDDYYPDSVSEDLLNRLAGVERLSVASRRSSFRYRNQETDQLGLVEIANRLGVRSLLSGYIRRSGSSIRLSLELVDVSSGREIVLWSNSYNDRPVEDMAAIQTEITRAIAKELIPEGLSERTEQRLARQSTQSAEAYEAYLRAQEILRGPVGDFDSLGIAVNLFTRAIDLDEAFEWAKAGLCMANTMIYERGGSFEAARESCERLISVDDDLLEVRIALGDYYLKTGDLDKADVELTAAVRLNPNSAEARILLAQIYAEHFYESQSELDRIRAEEAYLEAIEKEPDYWFVYHSYAIYLNRQNRLKDALTQVQAALKIKPTSVPVLNNLGNVQYRLGNVEAAEASWQKSILLNGDNRWAYSGLGVMYHYQGEYAKAVENFLAACRISPDDHELWGGLGESYRMLEDGQQLARDAFTRAVNLAEQNAEINPTNWRTNGFLALYYAYLGQFEQAQARLATMFELNPGSSAMTHYWAALVAYERRDVDLAFAELDRALVNGFSKEKQFIEDEPALASLKNAYPIRYQELLDRY